MPTCKVKTQYIFAPVVRVDDDERIVEGYCFCNPAVKGDSYSVSRKAMEDATPEYLRWGAVRAMHQPIAAGTAEAIVWDENGALLRAKIVDDQEWRKVKAGVYKGFSIGVKPELVRGNSVEKLTWVENSLVDRPKDPDAVFTVARAEGVDPGEEFECELLPAPDAEIERATVAEDGVQNAQPDEEGYRPVKAGDCTIRREGDLYVLNGPDGALIGKFGSFAEARQRAAEVQDAMKDGPGGQDDATDQHGTTLVLPTDRAEAEIWLEEGEDLRFASAGPGVLHIIRASDGTVIHEAENWVAAGEWIKAHTRSVTSTTPSLPVRENLEGKTPKEERASDGDADDEKSATCRRCGASCTRCSGMRAEEADETRAENHTETIPEEAPPEPVSDTPDSTLTIARLETDNAALILRASAAEAELARVQSAQEVLTRDLAAARERVTKLEAMPVAQQPLRFAHAVTREFFANARVDHDGETARIVARMTEITAMPPTQDLGEQAARAQEYQCLKMALAQRG
jgi:hypothetical protein